MIPSCELNSDDRDDLVRLAHRSMAKLSGRIAAFYPLATAAIGFATSLHQRWPTGFFGLLLASLVLAAFRFRLNVRFDDLYARHPRRWRRQFDVSLLAIGGLWMVFLCRVVAERGLGTVTMLGFLFSTVVAGFSLNTLTPSLTLTRTFVTVMTALLAVAFSMLAGPAKSLAALFVLPYGFQLWSLSRRLHSEYWEHAIQTRIHVRRSAEHERERDRLQKIRRELETEVDKRVADYRRIFENAHDAIVLLDPEREVVLDVNRRACEMYGFARSELVGMPMADLSGDSEGERRHVARTLELDEPYDFETVQHRKDGVEMILEVSAAVTEYQGRKAILSIRRDVTDRKRAREELEEHRRHLEEQVAERTAELELALTSLESQNAELEDRAAEMERFTYTISHDLKSPLITIRGFLGLLEKDLDAGHAERAQRDMARIHDAATRMGHLLDELLELSRVGRVINPPEAVALGDLVREAVDLLAGPIAERGAAIAIDPELPVVHGDRFRLLEVLQNLIENAVKFTDDPRRPRIEIGARHGDETVFYVRDNGLGIDPRYHHKVFGLFERLDPQSRDGTGIGLALVKRIVELHGGRVWVESDGVGRGSTFCWTLPGSPAAGSAEADA